MPVSFRRDPLEPGIITNIMYKNFKTHLEKELQDIKDAGLYKNERVIVTPQSSDIEVEGTKGEVLNFCANNLSRTG